jgi:sarcosine oxidase subunit gamma
MKRASPLAEIHGAPHVWQEQAGMRVPEVCDIHDAHRAANLGLIDLSAAWRTGCKGPGAADWLGSLGFALPAAANHWLPAGEQARLLRLGRQEYLYETDTQPNEGRWQRLHAGPWPAQVYPVPRQDVALLLVGAALRDLLAQTCNVNVAALDVVARPVALTSLAGVAVVLLPEHDRCGQLRVRLWAEAGYAAYLAQTLGAIAVELGGGWVGRQQAGDTV